MEVCFNEKHRLTCLGHFSVKPVVTTFWISVCIAASFSKLCYIDTFKKKTQEVGFKSRRHVRFRAINKMLNETS